MKRTLIAIVGLFLSFSILAEELSVNILAQDESIVTAVKTEGDNLDQAHERSFDRCDYREDIQQQKGLLSHLV